MVIDPNGQTSSQCPSAGDALGYGLLKSDPGILTPTSDMMAAVKALAGVAVAIGMAHAELVQLKQRMMNHSSHLLPESVVKSNHGSSQLNVPAHHQTVE